MSGSCSRFVCCTSHSGRKPNHKLEVLMYIKKETTGVYLLKKYPALTCTHQDRLSCHPVGAGLKYAIRRNRVPWRVKIAPGRKAFKGEPIILYHIILYGLHILGSVQYLRRACYILYLFFSRYKPRAASG